ncbi:VOC family protein [Phytomonospora sp. NPDC050363]|uniref:VOC family protein n=1 Tax=Phytomonospora sp. NPDC050363 TaxID=3155642 RepID=UPI0033E7B1C2
MANEVTIPALPCASIDETAEFYQALGFTRTYRQTRPNPFMIVKREDIELQFFGIDGFKAADSYGTCVVIVPDIGEIYEAFAAGMRAAYGKVLVAGIPRVTRPRKRKNVDGLAGFSLVDTGGNWIRFFPRPPADEPAIAEAGERGRLGRALDNAVVLGDSKGDERQAARILDSTLRREGGEAAPAELVEALVYRAELAVRLGEDDVAREHLARAGAVELGDAERSALAGTLAEAAELSRSLD